MLKALCLGWVTDSLKVILGLRGAGIETVVVNTHPARFFDKVPALCDTSPVSLNLYWGVKTPKVRIFRFLFTLYPKIGFPLSRRLVLLLREYKVDFVFAHWGVGVLPEVALIKSVAPSIPIILNMETFPTAPSGGLREAVEQWIFKKMAWALDGLIIPSDEMAAVLFKLAPSLKKKPCWVKPFYYPREFAPREILQRLSTTDRRPHIVFMGQFNARHSINDVRQDLIALANTGIVLHCVRMPGLEHPNIIQFEPYGGEALISGKLTSYMTQFDACLVTYAAERQKPLRFKTSLPSRFLIALAAGIPVVLPAGRFDAMERFVRDKGIGFAYENPYEVFENLKSDKFSDIQRQVRARQKNFILDCGKLREFIERVIKRST